jgi:phospho-N-acetylmuramoyl-pentapeptide-transferase
VFILFRPLSDVPATWTSLPFLAEWYLYITPILFVPWVMFVLAGGSNAVNLTDGLDGLAGGLSAIAAGTFGVFAYLIGRADTSRYLGLFYMPGSGRVVHLLFRTGRRVPGLPLVQCAPRRGLHG